MAIDRIKILFGIESDMAFDMFRVMERCFSKREDETEYDEEKGGEGVTRMYMNESAIGRREGAFFRIDPWSDITRGTREDLLFRYMESQLAGIEYEESFSALSDSWENVSRACISSRLNTRTGDTSLQFSLHPITVAWLMKNIETTLCKEELRANRFHLSFRESFSLKVSLISRFARRFSGNVFVVFNGDLRSWMIPLLQKRMGSLENVFCLLGTEIPHIPTLEMRHYAFCGSSLVDGYEWGTMPERVFMDLPFFIEGDEVEMLLKRCVLGEKDKKTTILRDFLRDLRL